MIKVNDYVDAEYRGSTFYGRVSSIDDKHAEAVVTFSPGVSMILSLAGMTVVDERPEEEN